MSDRKTIPASEARAIVQAVADQTRVPVALIMGLRRWRDVVDARQNAYLALRRRGCSYGFIGNFMGRDHATVRHGTHAAERRA